MQKGKPIFLSWIWACSDLGQSICIDIPLYKIEYIMPKRQTNNGYWKTG